MSLLRKQTNREESPVSQLHFAVAPYKVQYEIPSEELYILIFEKGFQVIGEMSEPIQNLNKMKEVSINFRENIFNFRMLSDRNSNYQWSLYAKRDQMEELVQSKTINLKDIIKRTQDNRVASQFLTQNQVVKFESAKLTLQFHAFCAFSTNDLNEAIK